MAGELVTVDVAPLIASRNGVEVTVTHTDPATWAGGNGDIRAEFSLNGGTSWTEPATLELPGQACIDAFANPVPAGNGSPALTETVFAMHDPTIPAGSNVLVRVTIEPDGDPGAGDVGTGDTTTQDYPAGFVCLATNTRRTSVDGGYGAGTGTVNLNGACQTDSVVWEIATTSGGPYTAEPSEQVNGPSPTHAFTGLTPGTTYFYRGRFTEQVDTNGEYLVGPECSFTTAGEDDFSEACQPATNVGPTSADLSGTADNVPATNDLVLTTATSAAGPWTEVARVTGDGTAGQTITGTATGLTQATGYFYRVEVREQGQDASNAVSVESTPCQFTTTQDVGSNFSEDCVDANPSFQHDDQARFRAVTTGVPTDHTVAFLLSDTGPTGPWDDGNSGPLGNGDAGATPQVWENVFTGLTPSTTYHLKVEVRDAGGVLVSEWSDVDCFRTTRAATDPNYIDNCTVQTYPDGRRNGLIAETFFDDLPLTGTTELRLDHSVNGAPYVPVPGANVFTVNGFPQPNPFPAAVGQNAASVRWPYSADDLVSFRWVLLRDGVEVEQTDEGNNTENCTVRTDEHPVMSCGNSVRSRSVTRTSADVTVETEPFRPYVLVPTENFAPSNTDQITLRWGTVSGGPYPNVVTLPPSTESGVAFPLTGLTPDTDYFYTVEAEEEHDTAGVFTQTAECSFRTLAEPAPVCEPTTNITQTTATVSASSDVPLDVGETLCVRVGSAPGLDDVFFDCCDAGTGQPCTWNVAGLTPATEYHVTVETRRGNGTAFSVVECDPFTTEGEPLDADEVNARCFEAYDVDDNEAVLSGAADGVPTTAVLRIAYATSPAGPWTAGPSEAGAEVDGQEVEGRVDGLTPGTRYYFRTEVVQGATVSVASEPCDFRTAQTPRTSGTTPVPCPGPDDGPDPTPAEPSTSTDDECLTDDNGVFFRRVSNDGEGNVTVTNVDVAGDPYTPVGTVGPCSPAQDPATPPEAETVEAHAQRLTAGPPDQANPGGTDATWAPPADLLAVSVTATNGTVTVEDANGDEVTLAPGETLSWSVNEDENDLDGPDGITANAPTGSALIAWTVRA